MEWAGGEKWSRPLLPLGGKSLRLRGFNYLEPPTFRNDGHAIASPHEVRDATQISPLSEVRHRSSTIRSSAASVATKPSPSRRSSAARFGKPLPQGCCNLRIAKHLLDWELAIEVRVRPDPIPNHRLSLLPRDRSVVPANPDRPGVGVAAQTLKRKTGVGWIRSKKPERLACLRPHLDRRAA